MWENNRYTEHYFVKFKLQNAVSSSKSHCKITIKILGQCMLYKWLKQTIPLFSRQKVLNEPIAEHKWN